MTEEQTTRTVILTTAVLAAVGLGLVVLNVYFSPSIPSAQKAENPITSPMKTSTAVKKDVREPAVAGSFYPAAADDLRDAVVEAIAAAASPSRYKPRLIVVPHAGYDYSAGVAAAAFKPLVGSGYRRAVLIGRSHHEAFAGVAADSHGTWATPLGSAKVDRDFIDELVRRGAVSVNGRPHDPEHALEVELPFVQMTLGPDVVIVPLLLGDEDTATETKLATALAELIDEETVVIVSSDLSHYPPTKAAATADAETIAGLMTGDPAKFAAAVTRVEAAGTPGLETAACGASAIATGLQLAQRLDWVPELYRYANSGQIAKASAGASVGYAAVGFYTREERSKLAAGDQASALAIAKAAVAIELGLKMKDSAVPPALEVPRGVFVTIKKNGELRGCIGTFDHTKPLVDNLTAMANEAAFDDPRFPPVTKAEWPQLEFEISVLTPPERVFDPRLIELGRHGINVVKGKRSGVFLPQVAPEQGWDLATTLTSLCTEKAGLTKDCWRDPDTELSIFTAQVF